MFQLQLLLGTQEWLLLAVLVLIVLQIFILRRMWLSPTTPALTQTRPQRSRVLKPQRRLHNVGEDDIDTKPSIGLRRDHTAHLVSQFQPTTVANGRVLVVDDNEINQLLFKKMLERYGLDVDVAKSGQDALSLLERQSFAAVFLDLAMPEIDGWEVAARMRRIHGHEETPLIIVSAHLEPSGRKRLEQFSVSATLPKPLQLADLEATLRRCSLIHPLANSS